MSASLLDDLLADYITPARLARVAPRPAKAAKPANVEHPCGLGRPSALRESLRISAKVEHSEPDAAPDSQNFAALRQLPIDPASEQTCGCSQDSQLSQRCPSACATAVVVDLAKVAWTDGDVDRFLERRARLLRWGWPEPEAERLAERLVKRDREQDERVSCADCRHYRPGRCGNHSRAGLRSPELGRDLAAMLQRCPGFTA